MTLFALTTDGAKSFAMIALLMFVAFGIISALVIKAIITKLLSLALFAFLSFGMASQRSSISSCAKEVKQAATSASGLKASCTFFGVKVNVPNPTAP